MSISNTVIIIKENQGQCSHSQWLRKQLVNYLKGDQNTYMSAQGIFTIFDGFQCIVVMFFGQLATLIKRGHQSVETLQQCAEHH